MTKTIEEVKAAKRELELKISQAVNEFAKTYGIDVMISVIPNRVICADRYDCKIEIKL